MFFFQDLRIVIGSFFAVVSFLLFVAAWLGHGGSGIENPNVLTAIGMTLFSTLFLGLGFKALRQNPL